MLPVKLLSIHKELVGERLSALQESARTSRINRQFVWKTHLVVNRVICFVSVAGGVMRLNMINMTTLRSPEHTPRGIHVYMGIIRLIWSR